MAKVRVNITIDDDLKEFIDTSYLILSKFVNKKLRELKNEKIVYHRSRESLLKDDPKVCYHKGNKE